MIKFTFTLDDETVGALERAAACLGRPKSQVVREAIRQYGEQLDRLPDEERDRMLELFDEVTSGLPERSRSDVERELAEVRRARRSGGRSSGKGGSR
ncbi:MAG: ribbon-helix-helix domain-containing protein [Longimicrobiales bacterium]|jgi:predicted transcriptional regulator|nr:ribbon-helix-helix domain-containing protein [Longimicrobiales bacterium]